MRALDVIARRTASSNLRQLRDGRKASAGLLRRAVLVTALAVVAALASILVWPEVAAAQYIYEVLHTFSVAPDANAPVAGLIQATDGNFYSTTYNGGTANLGTVFTMGASGSVVILHSFTGADGANPSAKLLQGLDGNFYGTTYAGGSSGNGTVFQMTSAGTVTVLHTFIGSDGASPNAGLIQATDGNFYGTTLYGGAIGTGTAFKISNAGAFTLLHSFGTTESAYYPNGGLIQATDGNFYGTTFQGGAFGPGAAFRMTASGTVTILHSFNGSGDGATPYAGLVQGTDGNFYGSTIASGPAGFGTAFKMTSSGALTVLHAFSPSDGGYYPYDALIQATDGNFYGTTNAQLGTVFMMTSSGALSVLHAFAGGSTDGFHSQARLLQAADGRFYGTTSAGGPGGGGVVFRLSPKPPTSITLTSSKNPSTVGQVVTFTASMSGGGDNSGSVTFKSDGSPLNCNGGSARTGSVATCSSSVLTAGNHAITVEYRNSPTYGDGNGTLSGGQTVNVVTSITVSSSANPSTFGQLITLTAGMSGGGDNSGNVTFKVDGGALFCNGGSGRSGSVAHCSTNVLTAGVHVITVEYRNSATYGDGDGTLFGGQSVSKRASAVSVGASGVFGPPVALAATVAGIGAGGGDPGSDGLVTFKVNGVAIAGCSNLSLSSSQATCSTSAYSSGSQSITAEYRNGLNFADSDGVLVRTPVPITVTSSKNPSTFGELVTFTAGLNVTLNSGTLTFKADGAPLFCDGGSTGGGPSTVATCSSSVLSGGSHVITAEFRNSAAFLDSDGTLSGGQTVGGPFPVNIQPGAYAGRYIIQKDEVATLGTFTGPVTLSLDPGRYLLDNNSGFVFTGLGTSYFRFTVDATGQISSVTNVLTNGTTSAATASGHTLTLNTVAISINPGAYTGQYVLSSHRNLPAMQGPQTVALIPDLLDLVDNSSGYVFTGLGSSYFSVYLDAAGQISHVINYNTNAATGAAIGSGQTLTFNTVATAINPGAYTGTFVLASHRNLGPLQGPQTLMLLPDLVYLVDNGSGFVFTGLGSSYFSVYLDAAGQISHVINYNTNAATGAASSSGNTLTFNTVGVRVDPTTYGGSYRVGGYAGVIGATQLWLLPNLATLVVTPDDTGLVFPEVTSFTPASLTLSVGGQPYTFNFTRAKAPATLTLGDSVFVYDGAAKSVAVITNPSGLSGVAVTYDGSPTAPSNPGSYTVVASLTNDNYQASNVTGTLVIVLADAGADQTVNEGDPVTLNGASSYGISYQWTQIAGSPTVPLFGATTQSASFTAPQLAGGFGSTVLTFRLTSSDGAVETSDTVDVTVKNVNHAPVPEPGQDQTVSEGSIATLNGSLSYDPDGDPIVSSQWTQTYGPAVSLTGANTATAAFVAPFIPGGVSGTLTLKFTLTVSDGALSSTPEEVVVTVNQVDNPPTADAGTNQTVNVNTLVALNGSGQDPDGDPITYTWTQTAGPAVTLSNIHVAHPTFTAPATAGQLTFSLVTGDGLLSSQASYVTVTTVNPVAPPVCTGAQARPSVLWPPDHKMVPINIVGVTDPNNYEVTITITSVTQDEPTSGLGDGDTPVDAVVSAGQLLLRAERSGTSDGRVYQVNFRADDGHGGSCTGSVRVGVPHNQGKQATPIDSGQSFNSMN